MLYHEHTNVWLTVHFLLRDLLHGTLYRSNFVAHPLTACFVAVLEHFYFLSFIPSDIAFYSLHFSLAIFIVRRPWTSDGGRHSKLLIDWLIQRIKSSKAENLQRRQRVYTIPRRSGRHVKVLWWWWRWVVSYRRRRLLLLLIVLLLLITWHFNLFLLLAHLTTRHRKVKTAILLQEYRPL